MPNLHLVNCKDRDGFKDILYVMADDDFRFDNGNYVPLQPGRFLPGRHREPIGHLRTYRIFETEDGTRWRAYSDWSVGRDEDGAS